MCSATRRPPPPASAFYLLQCLWERMTRHHHANTIFVPLLQRTLLGYHSRDTASPIQGRPAPGRPNASGEDCSSGQCGHLSLAAGGLLCTDARRVLAPFGGGVPPLEGGPFPPSRPRLLSSAAGVARGRVPPGPGGAAPAWQVPLRGSWPPSLAWRPGPRAVGRTGWGRDTQPRRSKAPAPVHHLLRGTPGSPKSASSWCPGPLLPPTAPKLLSSRLP